MADYERIKDNLEADFGVLKLLAERGGQELQPDGTVFGDLDLDGEDWADWDRAQTHIEAALWTLDALDVAVKHEGGEWVIGPKAQEHFDKTTRQGYTVLSRSGEDALLFRPDNQYEPFVVASGYDEKTGQWSQGSYFSYLGHAWDKFRPDKSEVVCDITWVREDVLLACDHVYGIQLDRKADGVEEMIDGVLAKMGDSLQDRSTEFGFELIYEFLPDEEEIESLASPSAVKTLDAIGFECKDLGLSDPAEWGEDHHDYEVTLSVGGDSQTFEFHCNPSFTSPTKAGMIDSIIEDMSTLRDYDDMYAFAAANGFNYDEDQGVARAQKLADEITEAYENLAALIGTDGLDALGQFLSDAKSGESSSIAWKDLEKREGHGQPASKASQIADLENVRREMGDGLGNQEPPEAGRDLPGDVLE